MIKATCVNRYRDKTGKIIGYCLVSGQQPKDFTSDELKKLIKLHKITVDNLILTKDEKLRFKTEVDESNIPIKDSIDMQITSSNKLEGFWTDDNEVYNEILKTGAVLKVSRGYWEVKYRPEKSKRVGVWVADGWSIGGKSIDKCIKELNKASQIINEYYSSKSQIPLEKEIDYSIKVYCTPMLKGRIWLMGSTIWISNKSELEKIISDLEYSKFRVLDIRKQLGWDGRNSFLNKMFGGF